MLDTYLQVFDQPGEVVAFGHDEVSDDQRAVLPSRCDCCKIRLATVEENSRPACLWWQCWRRYR